MDRQADRHIERQTAREQVYFRSTVHSTHLTQSSGLNRAQAINHVICQAACLLRRLHLYPSMYLYLLLYLSACIFCSVRTTKAS